MMSRKSFTFSHLLFTSEEFQQQHFLPPAIRPELWILRDDIIVICIFFLFHLVGEFFCSTSTFADFGCDFLFKKLCKCRSLSRGVERCCYDMYFLFFILPLVLLVLSCRLCETIKLNDYNLI